MTEPNHFTSGAVSRDSALQTLLDSFLAGLTAKVVPGSDAEAALNRAKRALSTCGHVVAGRSGGVDLPAFAQLQPALESAKASGGSAGATAAALDTLAPKITWYRREGLTSPLPDFADRHALASLIGPADRQGTLEIRDDVRVGISLVAPETPYPDHRHPPEELYLALTPGEWRQDLGPWFEPGPGGIVFNTSNILHGMRASSGPQLALWCLPID